MKTLRENQDHRGAPAGRRAILPFTALSILFHATLLAILIDLPAWRQLPELPRPAVSAVSFRLRQAAEPRSQLPGQSKPRSTEPPALPAQPPAPGISTQRPRGPRPAHSKAPVASPRKKLSYQDLLAVQYSYGKDEASRQAAGGSTENSTADGLANDYDGSNYGLSPEQEREVSYVIDSIQVPISIRRKYRDPMVSQLQLVREDGSLRLVHLTGHPYLRAEIFRQFEEDGAAGDFARIMASLGRDELFVTVNLRTYGSVHGTDTHYRSRFEGSRLKVFISQVYLIDTRGLVLPDEHAKRAEEINRQRAFELTQSLAFREIVRNRTYRIQ